MSHHLMNYLILGRKTHHPLSRKIRTLLFGQTVSQRHHLRCKRKTRPCPTMIPLRFQRYSLHWQMNWLFSLWLTSILTSQKNYFTRNKKLILPPKQKWNHDKVRRRKLISFLWSIQSPYIRVVISKVTLIILSITLVILSVSEESRITSYFLDSSFRFAPFRITISCHFEVTPKNLKHIQKLKNLLTNCSKKHIIIYNIFY